MDLILVLPDFSTKSFTHILPPLERAKVTTVDLITLDALEIAKRARVPPADVRRLSSRIVEALHADIGFNRPQSNTGTSSDVPDSSIAPEVGWSLGPATKRTTSQWSTISTLDPAMDALLGGGIPTRYVTEVTGESGSGKTQFLLSLCLAVQLPKPHGLQRRAIYISTEHPLSTTRLSQLLECHPVLSALPAEQAPSLQDILSINAMDLESQDHILNIHLPIAIERYNIGLVIVDSITSNYRAELSSNNMQARIKRSTQIAKLGHFLRNLAVNKDIAIVLANQVSDRFEPINGSVQPVRRVQSAKQTAGRGSGMDSPHPRSRAGILASGNGGPAPSSSPAISSSPYHAQDDKNFDGSYLIAPPVRNGLLNLAHQERFFTGWGDGVYTESGLKNPALGFIWTTQVSCRIALKKETRATGLFAEAYPNSMRSPERGTQDVDRDPDSIAMPAPSRRSPGSGAQSQQFGSEPEVVTRRLMKLVFSPWSGGLKDGSRKGRPGRRSGEVEFEIWEGGLRSMSAK
ncbi:DNA recombination and repair protein Rad51 C-terminal [Penicillium bovifimosum]|uniref:DNA recombination and repair protein Rad51 C-terminal n=1 Tax=Penicillium bovifimosum TaxID=126998 RepID=A0A9W9L4F0_9EURO|nr:DNA recombination and repair protein Rad51 C-terminal [Penicillium bovifimosum]KAJ5135659.1 DNA recombination and repair protein Rad51 C-terminal [Penicillium bovifimosum]